MTFESLPGENWLPVVGYEDTHLISDHGRCYSMPRVVTNGRGTYTRSGCMLQPGYGKAHHHPTATLVLCRAGRRRTIRVHHLVLTAFVGPCPDGMHGLHWDDEATNNHLSNLRWGTPGDNGQDRLRNGRNPQTNKTKCPQGHPYSTENTYARPDGARACIKCCRKRTREWRKRQRDKRLGIAA